MKQESNKNKFSKKLFSWQAKQSEAYKNYVKTSAVGLEFGLSIALSSLCGYFADNYFHSSPVGLIIGVIIGTIAGVKRLVLFTKKYLREQEKNNNHDDES